MNKYPFNPSTIVGVSRICAELGSKSREYLALVRQKRVDVNFTFPSDSHIERFFEEFPTIMFESTEHNVFDLVLAELGPMQFSDEALAFKRDLVFRDRLHTLATNFREIETTFPNAHLDNAAFTGSTRARRECGAIAMHQYGNVFVWMDVVANRFEFVNGRTTTQMQTNICQYLDLMHCKGVASFCGLRRNSLYQQAFQKYKGQFPNFLDNDQPLTFAQYADAFDIIANTK